MEEPATLWAVVWATLVGPIAGAGIALLITHWREALIKKRQERSLIFSTLMSTRSIPINADHVRALNMVEVVFYKETDVITAWKAYIQHLRSGTPESEQSGTPWRDERERLLARLLSKIGEQLGYKIPELDIYRGGYHPGGWDYQNKLHGEALIFMSDVANGRARIPMSVWLENSVPPEPSPPERKPKPSS